MSRARRYVFTVATGRCGQSSLTDVLERHAPGCHAAFEAPHVKPVLPGALGAFERRLRRRYVETNELLGRGKVLEAYARGDHGYIEAIARRRLRRIHADMDRSGAHVYVDVSKFFARGLHVGFARAVGEHALIHLVRDPVRNMRSFLNRAKNFTLDNHLPDTPSNELRLAARDLAPGELYLWAWCELSLRFAQLRRSPRVTHAVEIRTEALEDAPTLDAALDALELEHSPVVTRPPRNTNVGQGLPATSVSAADIHLFERFVARLPEAALEHLPYLHEYDPWTVHGVERRESA